MILPIISYATEIYLSGQRPPSYPHDARMIGKLELTRADWEGLSKEGYPYELHLEDPFLPHGFPEPKDGLIIEPNVQVVIHARSPEALQEKSNSFIGKILKRGKMRRSR